MTRRRRRPLILIRDLEPGTSVDSYFLVRNFTPGGSTGPRLRARLWDRTGEAQLIAWRWENHTALNDGAYRVAGTVGTYAGNVQISAEAIEPCPGDIDLHELLPCAPRPIEEMWSDLERLCATLTHPGLSGLLQLCLQETELCERWRYAPAAVRHHHAYAGGLLEHTLGVTNVALSLAGHYPAVDRDLLLAGALLHDIGKTEAYGGNGVPDMTDRGRLLGHIYPGARLVEKLIDRLPGFSHEVRDRLLHLIGSHHGERQFGVLEVPKTPEAILLHYADNIDAKMHAILAACAQANGQTWTAPVRSLSDERFYVGSSGASLVRDRNGDDEDGDGEEYGADGNLLDLLDGDPFASGLFSEEDFER